MDITINEGATAAVVPQAENQLPQSSSWSNLRSQRFVEHREANGDDEASEAAVLESCLRRISSWRVPPNWSARDWLGEMRLHGAAALWQARCDYDPTRGVPLSAFERLRVLASARTRYRQEWRYALHCTSQTDDSETDESPVERLAEEPVSFARQSESVREALAHISAMDRWLIEQLFWADHTEAAVAVQMGISQQAVSKRKRAVLKELERWLGASGNN